jgi:hypothetical protein
MLAGLCLGLLAGVNLIYAAFVPLVGLYGFWPPPAGVKRPLSRMTVSLRPVLAFALPIGLCLALIGLYNAARFGSPTKSGYYFGSGEGFNFPFLTGVYGLTISPYRGLFWYNPALILALPGWWLLRRSAPRLAWLALALAVGQLLVFASWWSWHGGVVWGPRFVLPALPLMTLWLAPLVESTWSRRWVGYTLIVFVVVSCLIQMLGALYDFIVYTGYLWVNFYHTDVSALADEVLVNPALSPILGHLALLIGRWPVEAAWLADGLDWAHGLAALALIGASVVIALRVWPPRRVWVIVGGLVFISLNMVAARQARGKQFNDMRALEAAMQPPGRVVAASLHFGDSLADVNRRYRIFSTNAPTKPDDPLALPIWRNAWRGAGNLWFVTWFRPNDPANWQERELWQTAAFAYEREAARHRALLFNLTPALSPDRAADYTFDLFRLERYGTAQTPDGLLATVEWSLRRATPDNYSWFIHLIGADGNIVAQQDRQPQGGYAPTSGWRADGTTVIDRLFFPGVGGAGLRLRIGWVNPATGERLPVMDRTGKVIPEGYVVLPVSPATP